MNDDEMAGHVARIEEMRSAYKRLDAKPEGKTPVEVHRRKNSIKTDVTEIVCCIYTACT
jgi:hypothetical protein